VNLKHVPKFTERIVGDGASRQDCQ